MLGTAFTAQHSDARVLDQYVHAVSKCCFSSTFLTLLYGLVSFRLIYKWAHSRSVIASVLIEEIRKLCISGWTPRRSDIRQEVRRLFGASYEEFMSKTFHLTDPVVVG
jgi:hypothetical protein